MRTVLQASAEKVDRKPRGNVVPIPPWDIDSETPVPMPFKLADWLAEHRLALASGACLPRPKLYCPCRHPDDTSIVSPRSHYPAAMHSVRSLLALMPPWVRRREGAATLRRGPPRQRVHDSGRRRPVPAAFAARPSRGLGQRSTCRNLAVPGGLLWQCQCRPLPLDGHGCGGSLD